MPVDKFGRMSDTKTKDTGVSLTYINNNYVRSDGETPLTGSLNMRGNTIYNVADPVNPQDVVTKVYVDNTKGSGVIGRKTKDGVSIKENMDFLGKQKIKNLPEPVDEKDAVTKKYIDEKDAVTKKYIDEKDAVTKEYVDTTTVPFLKLDQTKYNTKGDIDMGDQFTVLNVKTPIDDNHITDKKYVDEMDNLKSAFSFRNGEYYAKGNIYLRKNKLEGLREPLQDGEAATKKYVDDKTKNLFIDENDNIAFGLNVDMEGNKIFSLPEPEQDNEPATKKYVDDLQTQHIDKRGNVRFDRNINVGNNRIFALKDPKKDYEATNKKYVDDSITKRLQEEKDNFLPQDPATKEYVDEAIKGLAGGDLLVSKEGVFIKANGHYRATAPLDIDNHKMENLPDPVDDKDAVNKKYIDGIVENLTLKQGLIRENGGFNLVDSYINMNFNNIRNVGYPKNEADAVPRKFVQDVVNSVQKQVQNQFKELNQLVSVCGSFHGNLKFNEYQFSFGGPVLEKNAFYYFKALNGFLVPANGLLKHFVTFSSGLIITIPGKTMRELSNENFKSVIGLYGSKDSLTKIFTLERISKYTRPEAIGGIYFKLINIKKINETYEAEMNFNFILEEKFKNKKENFICSVNQGDIINIKTNYEEDKDFNIEGSTSFHLYNHIQKLDSFNFANRSLHLTTLTFLFKEMSFPNVLND